MMLWTGRQFAAALTRWKFCGRGAYALNCYRRLSLTGNRSRSRPFEANPSNPWRLSTAAVSVLIAVCGLTWQEIAATPPRILYNLLDYAGQKGFYARRIAPGPLETPMSPAEFRQFVEQANDGRR